MAISTAAASGIAIPRFSPASSPAAATISGDGVSPAASAAASGSLPGRAAETASAERGRRDGSGSRQRAMMRSTAGSRSRATLVRLTGVLACCAAISSASELPSNGRLPGEHLVQQQAQRVDVAANRHFLAGKLLGRHVGRRAAANVAQIPRRFPTGRNRSAAPGRGHRASHCPVSGRGGECLFRGPPQVRRRACARSPELCRPATGRCAAAVRPGPPRRYIPSTGRTGPALRPGREPGRRWDETPGAPRGLHSGTG